VDFHETYEHGGAISHLNFLYFQFLTVSIIDMTVMRGENDASGTSYRILKFSADADLSEICNCY
jgi:hypothetical protein